MSMTLGTVVTPAGNVVLRSYNGGVFGPDDLAKAQGYFGPSGPFHNRPYICVLNADIVLPTETRRQLMSFPPDAWSVVAFVVLHRALRSVAPIMFKIIGLKNVMIFGTEAEAMVWIDGVISSMPPMPPLPAIPTSP